MCVISSQEIISMDEGTHVVKKYISAPPPPIILKLLLGNHTGNRLLFLIQNLMNVRCEGWVQVATATLIVLDSLTHSEITLFCSLLAKDVHACKGKENMFQNTSLLLKKPALGVSFLLSGILFGL